MTKMFILLLTLCVATVWARSMREDDKRMIRVAVIDTGIDTSDIGAPRFKNMLCDSGHKDFTVNERAIRLQPQISRYILFADRISHGTHIAGLIDQYVKGITLHESTLEDDITHLLNTKANYCQIILKYYDAYASGEENVQRMQQALRAAIDLKVDVINISGGGEEYITREAALIREALNKKIKIVVAAGNNNCKLNSNTHLNKSGNYEWCSFYPAQYDSRIIVVGALDASGAPTAMSNFGKEVNAWELGDNVLSFLPENRYGYLAGTSQATAIKTGKIIRQMLLDR